MDVTWHPSARDRFTFPLGALTVTNATNARHSAALDEEIEVRLAAITEQHTLAGLKDHPVARAFRNFYWQYLDIDPTKTRPSGEALARRVVGGKPFPRINVLVDAYNVISASHLVPVSALDLSTVDPPLLFRRAPAGTEFTLIGGRTTTLKGNELVVTDARGRLLSIYPYRDADISKITLASTRVAFLASGAPGLDPSLLRATLRDLATLLEEVDPASTVGAVELHVIE